MSNCIKFKLLHFQRTKYPMLKSSKLFVANMRVFSLNHVTYVDIKEGDAAIMPFCHQIWKGVIVLMDFLFLCLHEQ